MFVVFRTIGSDGVDTLFAGSDPEILVRNRDKVVTYAALDRALGTNRAIDERNPWRVSISKIRKQLGVGPQRPVVHTELRVGYRLIVPDDAP